MMSLDVVYWPLLTVFCSSQGTKYLMIEVTGLKTKYEHVFLMQLLPKTLVQYSLSPKNWIDQVTPIKNNSFDLFVSWNIEFSKRTVFKFKFI